MICVMSAVAEAQVEGEAVLTTTLGEAEATAEPTDAQQAKYVMKTLDNADCLTLERVATAM